MSSHADRLRKNAAHVKNFAGALTGDVELVLAESAQAEAENQRLREALIALVKWSETIAAEEDSEVHALFAFAREALAGDTE